MKQWIAAPAETGMRLDKLLVTRSKQSRQQVKRWLNRGIVHLNGRTVEIAKWVVKSGDQIVVEEVPITPAHRERRAARHFVDVLYEDTDLIAVDKPAGMIVVPEERTNAPTVVDAVRAYLRRKYPTARGTYIRALHRLDRGTSGIMLLAKTRAAEAVIQQFKRHSVLREYLAVVHGAMRRGSGTVKLPLAKGEFGHGRKVAVLEEGKPAITHFEVEERYPAATLARIRVETGRTHQIRVHLAAIGHPLIGDQLYGFPPARRDSASRLGQGRQALHATRLKLRQPQSGTIIDIESPLPSDLARLIDRLRSG